MSNEIMEEMKRFIFLWTIVLAPLMAMAQAGQYNGSGYYRVQAKESGRYLTVVDPTKIYTSNTDVILKGLHTIRPFEERVVSNPATIVYIEQVGKNGSTYTINLKGQGLDLYQRAKVYLNILQQSGGYLLYGAQSGFRKWIYDSTYSSDDEVIPEVLQTGTSSYPSTYSPYQWYILPVNESEGQYFGVKPDITASADGSSWATMYASFPFTCPSDMKTYIVSRVDGEYAVIKEVSGVVPSTTPLLIRCGSASPAGNKLTLSSTSPAVPGGNQLKGNYYMYLDTGRKPVNNVLDYNPSTMRMLGTDADGKPAFVVSDIKYVPANKCYLPVSSSAPATLKIVTEDEYLAGVETITIDGKVVKKGVYTLSGLRVGDTPEGLSKGVYIFNGRKVVVK